MYTPDELLDSIKNVQITVRESVKKALCNCGFPKDVLNYMDDVGVEVEDLADAGMELVVGVEKQKKYAPNWKSRYIILWKILMSYPL